jgi:thiamine-monophosphate kinase
MGADPAWALLALTLPARDEDWLAGFAGGFKALAATHEVALIGGDTTRGPLSITVQLSGFAETSLRRCGARPGDRVWVSGDLGASAGGLQAWQAGWQDADSQTLIERFLYPEPRCSLGTALVGRASAAIDISDGLVADAGHIAERSGVGLHLLSSSLPRAAALSRRLGDDGAQAAALRGGDDYELLFTASPANDAGVADAASRVGVAVTAIGEVTQGSGVYVDGTEQRGGYDHFAADAP